MSMFPTPLTKDENLGKFHEFIALAESKGADRTKALEMAVLMHAAWCRAEVRSRMPILEYRVIYRRHGWTHTQVRLYQRKGSADAFMKRLREPYKDCEPLAELRLEERRVESVWWPRSDEVFPR